MSGDLAKFLAARFDEDERAADAVVFACRDSRQPWPPEQAPGRGGPALTAYLKHFSEHRSVREVAAKRSVLARHEPLPGLNDELFCAWCSTDTGGPELDWPWPCQDALAIAAVYSDHPDCRPEWKP